MTLGWARPRCRRSSAPPEIAVAGTFCDSKNSVIIRCTAGSSSITRT